MTKQYVGEPPSRPIDDSDHSSILALLPEYVTICILAQQPPPQWQPLEQHLMRCSACRSEADALTKLMGESYTGALPAVPAPPPPDLTFLDPAIPAPPPDLTFLDHSVMPRAVAVQHTNSTHPPARIGSSQPIVFQFSAALLPRMRVHMAARTGGIRLRYAYEIPPTDDTDPTITVEVLVHDDQPTIGLVRVCVEYPDRSPFDQAGSHVTLQIDDTNWSGVTDQNGVTAFADVPLDQMERWQITIAP
jgi:hypothetical protein